MSKSNANTWADRAEHQLAKSLNFGAKQRIRLYQRLERFTKRGFDFKRAIDSMYIRYNREKDPRRAVFRRLLNRLQDGDRFSAAIAEYVPAAERLMISAGEEASQISDGFEQAAFVADAVKRMSSTLRSALIYPTILMLLLSAILAGISLQFVPTMLQMAPVETWPAVSKAVYNLANAVTGWGPWLVATFVVGLFFALRTLPTWTGPTRRFCDRWFPPWTIYREYQGSTFLISLAALVAAGRPVDGALRHISSIATPWLRWHLARMTRALQEGVQPGRALRTGLLDKETSGDIEDYSNAGAFEAALGAMGRESIEDSILRIKAAANILTVLSLVAVAGTIVLVYTGMIFLVMDVAQQARSSR
jgi:type II secretory pathway component PulF